MAGAPCSTWLRPAAGFFLVANYLLLRESRAELGYREAAVNPQNVYGDGSSKPANFAALVLPLFRSRAFLMICLLSLGCTIVRETFNDWIPIYLHFFGYSMGGAASASAVFPAVGAVSVILAGWLSDRLGAEHSPGGHGRGADRHGGGTGAARSAAAERRQSPVAAGCHRHHRPVPDSPYSYLGGALACDFGGKQGTAQSSGIIDGVGYLGSVLGGVTVARASVAFGWGGVFLALAVISLAAAAGAVYLHHLTVRTPRSGSAPS